MKENAEAVMKAAAKQGGTVEQQRQVLPRQRAKGPRQRANRAKVQTAQRVESQKSKSAE